MKHRLGLAAALLVGLAADADAQTQVKRGFNLFSKEQDVELGRKASAETEREIPVLADADATALVEGIGRKLAGVSQGPKFPYSFKVVDVADLNAFALPGGPVYVNRGLVEAARNDGEIAGVLAHEIAHVALRHGTHEVSKAMRAQLLVGAAAGVIGGDVASIVEQFGGLGLQALFLKYSRKAETEADVVGVQTLVKAGYDPADMIGFFQTLNAQDKRRVAEWMSSHPSPENRIERIRKEAGLLAVAPREGAAPAASAELRRVQEKLKRMAPAPTMEELKKRGGAAGSSGPTGATGPSGRVASPSERTRRHASRDRSWELRAPEDWQVIEQDDSGLSLAPAGGSQRSGGATEITWGAIVGRHRARSPSAGLDEILDDLVASVRSTSPYLRATSSAGRVRDESGEGRTISLAGMNPRTGESEAIRLGIRPLGRGEAAFLLFVTPQDAPREWDAAWQALMRSFRAGR